MEMQLVEDSDKKVKCNKTRYQLIDSNARSLKSTKCPEIRLRWLCSGFAVFVILISIFSGFLYTLQTLQTLQIKILGMENSTRINNVSAHLEELLQLALSQKTVNSKLKAGCKPGENDETAERDDKFVQVANALSSIADSVAETNEKMDVFTNSSDSNYKAFTQNSKAFMENKLDNISRAVEYLKNLSDVRDVEKNLEQTIKKGFDFIQSWTVNSFTNFTKQLQLVTNQTEERIVQLQDTTSRSLINFSGELKNISRNTSEVIGSLERKIMESLRNISSKSSISLTSIKEAIAILDSRLDSLTNLSVTERNNTDCPTGYKNLGGTCYAYMYMAELGWADAVAHCKKFGSILAEPKTSEEIANINQLALDNRVDGYFWIGGHLTSGQWTWASSGEAITYLPWAPGEPRNKGRCLSLYQFGPGHLGMDDDECLWESRFVCQASPTQSSA